MTYIIQFLVAMLATISFAIIFNAPRKELLYCGINGAIGWIVFYVLTKDLVGVVAGSLIATFCLSIFARLFAAKRKKPVTVYLLTGIFSLVPGAGIYYTAYYFFASNKEMLSYKGAETLEIAIAIVFGIIFGFAIPQNLFNKMAGNDKND